MGKYLKLAAKVITQDTSIIKGHCYISDKSHPSIEPENTLRIDEARERDCDIRDKSDQRVPRVDSSNAPVAARIYSRIIGEEVWVCNSAEALSLVPEGGIVYLPEEIRGLKGATQEEIQAIHRIKKELGGKLIAVQEKGG